MVARLLPPAALVALAACSDGSDGAFSALDEDYAAIEEPASLTFEMQREGLPTSGSASFGGVMRIETEGIAGLPEEMLGEMDLVLDFESTDDLVTGAADRFVGADGERLDGELALTDGRLSGDEGAEFEASLDGMLAGSDGEQYEFLAPAEGVIKGNDLAITPTLPTFVQGRAEGVVTTDGGSDGFSADFVTIRDGVDLDDF